MFKSPCVALDVVPSNVVILLLFILSLLLLLFVVGVLCWVPVLWSIHLCPFWLRNYIVAEENACCHIQILILSQYIQKSTYPNL